MVQVAPTYHNGLIGEQPAPAEAAVAARRLRREGGFPVLWLITPGALWLTIFLIVPHGPAPGTNLMKFPVSVPNDSRVLGVKLYAQVVSHTFLRSCNNVGGLRCTTTQGWQVTSGVELTAGR